MRIITGNSLEKTYAELRSMQIDANDSTYMLAGKSACNTKSVRHSIWKGETFARFLHATTHRRETRTWLYFINQSTNSST